MSAATRDDASCGRSYSPDAVESTDVRRAFVAPAVPIQITDLLIEGSAHAIREAKCEKRDPEASYRS